MSSKRENGFTIYELMITVLIVGLVVALGLPSLGSVSRDNRIALTASELQNAFKIARSEAIRASNTITLCASDNAMADDADCRGDWQNGYIIFNDLDGNLVRAGADETLIQVQPALPDGIQLAVENDARYFSFSANGTGRGDVDGRRAVSRIVICDDRGVDERSRDKSSGELLVATPLGHMTATRDHDIVSNALRHIDGGCG